MKLIRVAAAVLNQTPLDWEGNYRNVRAAIDQARDAKSSVLCLPELVLTGYGCEDAFHSPGVQQTAVAMLQRLLPATSGLIVSVGMPLMYAGGLFNTACLIVDRKIVGAVAKQHLPGDGIHYEPRWFKPWPRGIHGRVDIGGQTFPIGDIFFDIGGIKVGFEICEDAWVGTRPGGSLASRGVDIILNPSASHFAFEKHAVRERFVLEGSRAFNVTYVYTNLVGNEAGRAIYDGDVMIASSGALFARGPRLSFDNHAVISATVDVNSNRMLRSRTVSFEPDVDGDETDMVPVPFQWPEVELGQNELMVEPWEKSSDVRFEEFTRAVSLGLFDYLRKSRSRGFVVSLSGGVDSTAVCVLVWVMCRRAVAELGAGQCAKRLGLSEDVVRDQRRFVAAVLTTVYQKTRNSSETTRSAAAKVADAIGATHYEWEVDDLVEIYTHRISEAIGRKLDWETDDIALQNIQARVRSPGAWMLANLNGALLLSTSNRSEAAVGYATMDGDTSGGLSPIAGIDKAFLRRWLRWMETTGPVGLEPIPALASVNQQLPTAELRPQTAKQTDEDDLMPYEVLDRIERLAIRDKLMPLEVYQHLVADRWSYSRQELCQWTIKFFRLWCRNQWKRERYAPSFHLDDANLDPKTWCRFPILSGGYELEIAQLEKFFQERTEDGKR
ncbi:MAG: NAD(+) synthase [Pirellulaceae bacterium]|nr:NAD(+) synthase [Pirellulaceae bacterium]